jgi:aspartyl-tRNA(Asn)/glutamyl-tRNA(Gln) amidotransferase subunit C
VQGDGAGARDLINVMREDIVEPSLPQEDVLRNAPAQEDGFIKAPRVM